MTSSLLVPLLVLSVATAACAKASDPIEDSEVGGAAGQGDPGGQAGSGGSAAGKGGSAGQAGAAGKGGTSSGGSGQAGAAGGGDPGGAGPGGTAGQGGEAGGGTSGGKSGSSGQSGAGQAGTGTAGTSSGCDAVVVINEVSTDGKDGFDEFVEIYNASDCKVDLAGWTLAYYPDKATSLDSNKIEMWKAPSSQPLAAKGYLVFAGSSFTGSKDAALGSGLGKSGAGLALFDASGQVIDRMAWGGVVAKHPCIEGTKCGPIDSNLSASRIPDGTDTDNNADDFKVNSPRTPGKTNQ